MKYKLSELKVLKMSDEQGQRGVHCPWQRVPLAESAYYECLQHPIHSSESKKIFLDYLRALFEYHDDHQPEADGKLSEMTYNRFAKIYHWIREQGFNHDLEPKVHIDSDGLIRDGQHRLAIWLALGNEYFEQK